MYNKHPKYQFSSFKSCSLEDFQNCMQKEGLDREHMFNTLEGQIKLLNIYRDNDNIRK